jgi:hypothetical protein
VDPRLAPLLQAALSPIATIRPHADEIVEALDRYAAGAPATVAVPMVDPSIPPAREYPGALATQVFDDDRDPEPESDWQAAWESGPGQPDPRIGRPSRLGTLLALMVGVLGVVAVRPVVGIGLIILWSWSARFADRSVTSLVVRRHESGRRRRDVPLAVVASPWHVITSAVATVIALLLPATVAISSTFSAALAIVALSGGDPQPDRSLPLVVGGFAGLLMLWWGPGGTSLRRGSRSLVRGVAPGKVTTAVVVAAFLLLGAGLGVWAWLRLGQPDWWPWVSGQFPLISSPFS